MIMVAEDDLRERSTREVAQLIDCSQRHVARLFNDGVLEGRRYGPRRIRIYEQSVIDYLQRHGAR